MTQTAADRLGTGWTLLFGVSLTAATYGMVLSLLGGPGQRVLGVDDPYPDALGAAGYAVTLLQAPVLVWGWWLLVARYMPAQLRSVALPMLPMLALMLQELAEIVSNAVYGRPQDFLDLLVYGGGFVFMAAFLGYVFWRTTRPAPPR
ncbi:hypothetical protein [Deinococcus sp. Leaf326]|uniref:hypothetical protein n=1 Tax=Deinococcus sp. Leaf326 TaxID=1736338 RepID=UPI0006F378C4|nr:hypothetical protein [Deinococcus sp. Leaf326]KQR27990.1 hypothetical protein ASF71_05270 [Deinococcus sp. Leaf326]